jgi:two-component system cell cycle sensor histidine kinase/response regulator CckA
MIAEDDPLVRGMVAEFLRDQGYLVLEAENGERALQLAATVKTVDVLITDVVMPRVDGVELLRRFRFIHPMTPALVVSGSVPDLNAIVEGFDRCDTLAKPFLLLNLLKKVRALLGSGGSLPEMGDAMCPPSGGILPGATGEGLGEPDCPTPG